MRQKVLKVGSSAAVTIPAKSLKELGLKPGDEVSVEINKKTRQVLISPAEKVDPEILAWTDSFIKKYRPALRALAKK